MNSKDNKGTVNGQKIGFFSRIFGGKKKDVLSEKKDQTVTPPAKTVEKLKPEPKPAEASLDGMEDLWKEFTDPLYVPVDVTMLGQECRAFVKELEKTLMLEEQNAINRQMNLTEQGQELEPKPIDAQIITYLSKNKMCAWIYVVAPKHGGSPVTLGKLKESLKEQGINTGIQESRLKRIYENKIYSKPVMVAAGDLAKDGVDGYCIDHYKRVVTLELVEDEKGQVDYKDLNNIQEIEKGGIICEIVPPVSGTPGMAVTGELIAFRKTGSKAEVPNGRNTVLSEDNSKILSQLDGHVFFANGRFNVEPVLHIAGDVDSSTGNLDFNGDIVIKGDVRNGFTVAAQGNVRIQGSVEGALIKAGMDIVIGMGVMGNGEGKLECDGNIRCRYLENCKVYAQGNVYADSIICSDVRCNDAVIATSGRGVIIGGRIVASKTIEAKTIGSKSHRFTELILGGTPHTVEEEQSVVRELKQLRHNLSELNKNISFLQSTNKPEKQILLEQLKTARDTLAPQEGVLEGRLIKLQNNDGGLNECRVRCSSLYPVTKIQIGSTSLQVQDEYSKCNIFYSSEGEVVIGTI